MKKYGNLWEINFKNVKVKIIPSSSSSKVFLCYAGYLLCTQDKHYFKRKLVANHIICAISKLGKQNIGNSVFNARLTFLLRKKLTIIYQLPKHNYLKNRNIYIIKRCTSICFLRQPYKFLTKVTTNKPKNKSGNHQPSEQPGFRAGFRAIELFQI